MIYLPFLLIVLYYLGLLFTFAPGFVSFDDISLVNELSYFPVSGWRTLTYSIFSRSFVLPFRNFLGMGFFSIGLFLLIALLLFNKLSKLEGKAKWFYAMAFLFACLLPIHQALLIFQNKDIIFSILLCGTCLYFHFTENPTKPAYVFLILFLLVLLADLRNEGKILLILFPIYALLLRLWSRKEFFLYYLWCVPLCLIFFYAFPTLFNYEIISQQYAATTYVQPLSQIYSTLKIAGIDNRTNENIDRVLDVQKLQDDFNPDDITPFHKGASRGIVNPESWEKFKISSIHLFLDHYDLWLNNRTYIALGMLNLVPRPFNFCRFWSCSFAG